MNPFLSSVLAVLVAASSAWAGIFDFGVRPADRIVVVTDRSVELPETVPPTPMLRRMMGVVCELSLDEMNSLRATAEEGKPAKPDADAVGFAVLRLFGPGTTKDIEIVRDSTGAFFAREFASEGTPRVRCVKMNRAKFSRLTEEWDRYRGTFALGSDAKMGEDFELARPYVPGWYRASRAELGERLLRGRSTRIPEPVRRLEDERFTVRLPAGYKPREATGLLVWVNAGTSHDLPDEFYPWLDRNGFVLIGAFNIGNSRPAADRYQLALDMVETARRGFVIDENRVYVTGISGGGRISSHLWMGWPEVFKGAAPIVGLGFYEPLPAGKGKTYTPDYDKPQDPQLNLVLAHPIAPISGPLDFNYPHIKPCTELMRLHGFKAKFIDVPEMGHSLPPPERFAEAMDWIDEPARKAAKELDERITEMMKSLPADEPKRTETLVEITRLAPWTASAWEAARLMAGQADTSPR
ncbi:MAG: hypothetical protein ACOYN0_04940 [Phycisphaerales bacterium]